MHTVIPAKRLKGYMLFSNSLVVGKDEVPGIIKKYNLSIYKNIWHYSFNHECWPEAFQFIKLFNGVIYLYAATPYDQWSPLLVYTNKPEAVSGLRRRNMITDLYDKKASSSDRIFWFLWFADFDEFLSRRDKNSSKPDKHFPSTKTYKKLQTKYNYKFFFGELNEEFFIDNYNRLTTGDYMNAKEILDLLHVKENELNRTWIKQTYLTVDDVVESIAIVIDDGRSICLFNIAAGRSSAVSAGTMHCTKIIERACNLKYFSFDAGISGKYGYYKDKLFLDSFEISLENKPLPGAKQWLKDKLKALY